MLLLNLVPFSSYIAVLPLTREEWGLNSAQAGAIYSAYLAGYAAAALFVVPLPDRWGCRPVVLGSVLLSSLGHLAFPLLAQDFFSAIVLRFVAGLGMVGVYMTGLRLIGERFAQRWRGAAMGVYTSCAYGAMSLSLALTAALIPALGWRDAYLTAAIFSLFSLPLAYLALRGGEGRLSPGSARLHLSVIREKVVRLVVLGYVAHSWELFLVRTWLPSFLVGLLLAQGYTQPEALSRGAGLAALFLAMGGLGPFLGGALSDRVGRTRAAALILLLAGLVSLSLGWLGGMPWWLLIPLGLFYGLALAADSSLYTTTLLEAVPPFRMGSALAVQSFSGFAAGIVSPIASGWVLDRLSGEVAWGVGFGLGGVFALAGFVGMLSLARRPHRSTPSQQQE